MSRLQWLGWAAATIVGAIVGAVAETRKARRYAKVYAGR